MALEKMATASPPDLFAGRWALFREQAAGGQAVVAFAREEAGSMKQFAIKCAPAAHTHPVL